MVHSSGIVLQWKLDFPALKLALFCSCQVPQFRGLAITNKVSGQWEVRLYNAMLLYSSVYLLSGMTAFELEHFNHEIICLQKLNILFMIRLK